MPAHGRNDSSGRVGSLNLPLWKCQRGAYINLSSPVVIRIESGAPPFPRFLRDGGDFDYVVQLQCKISELRRSMGRLCLYLRDVKHKAVAPSDLFLFFLPSSPAFLYNLLRASQCERVWRDIVGDAGCGRDIGSLANLYRCHQRGVAANE